MKRLIQIIIFIFIFGANNSYAHELVGPKIFGLQLGMQFNKVLEIANKITENNCEQIDQYGLSCYSSKFGRLNIIFNNGILSMYSMPLTYFNYNGSMDERVFLKQLIEHYKIPELDYISGNNRNYYQYKNSNEGYQITISFSMFGEIKVNSIEKISDLNFK